MSLTHSRTISRLLSDSRDRETVSHSHSNEFVADSLRAVVFKNREPQPGREGEGVKRQEENNGMPSLVLPLSARSNTCGKANAVAVSGN